MIPATGIVIPGPNDTTIRLEEPMGGGAFGVVFKAIDTVNNIPYAVKFPQSAMFGGVTEAAAFENEIKAAREIDHPNVVKVLHVETNHNQLPPYLVMEFMSGGTIKSQLDLLKESGQLINLELLRYWTTSLIDGLSTINEKMLHRDLKPDNILLEGNVLKISDFGLSKLIGAATRSLTFKGGQHILYMAPEGWDLETNDIQIDMYALGIVLFEMASLKYPYQLPTDQRDIKAIRDMHLYQQPLLLRSIRPDIPIEFSQIVLRLLEKNPKDRYSNWTELKQAFDRAWNLSSAANKTGSMISLLLNEGERLHQSQNKKKLDEDQRKIQIEEETKLDNFQKEKIVSIIREATKEFNEHSTFGQIQELQMNRFESVLNKVNYKFNIPFGGSLNLYFMRVDPPLKLKRGYVRFVGVLKDQDGAGVHFLLCRKDEKDLYGSWCVCVVNVSGLVDRRKYSSIEPVTFEDSKKIHEIERADGTMHVYTVTYSDNIKEAVHKVVLESFSRK